MSEQPSTQDVNFDQDLSYLEYKTNHGAPNFHAITRDCYCDLLIKVFDLDDKLQGCIPCDKALAIQEIGQIALKFKETSGTIWSDDKEHGMSVFDLKTHIEPEIVSDFIRAIYEGKADLKSKGWSQGVPFFELARFLMCEKLIQPMRKYVMENVNNDTLIETWALVQPDDSFQQPCIDFVKTPEFRFEILLDDIGNLTIEKFTEFINKACEPLTNSDLISLRRTWLNTNPDKKNYETTIVQTLIFDADFEGVSDQEKIMFYDEMVVEIKGELAKRASKHEILTCFLTCFQNMKYDFENPCNKFVSGTCVFDENFASLEIADYEGIRFDCTNAVRTDVAEYTWKLRMDRLITEEDTQDIDYFGIAAENQCGDGVGYAWCNDSQCHILGRNRQVVNETRSWATLNGEGHRDYGSRLKTGDILEVKLDQVKHTLEFFKNGVSQGIAHDNLPVQKYKLAVTLTSEKNKVTLI